MTSHAVVQDSIEMTYQGPDISVLRLGLLVPLSGPLGLTGPSALGAACLAADEVNRVGGVQGRPIELVVTDAGRRPEEVAREALLLARSGVVDAFVGSHTSDVHRAIEGSLGGRAPYIFTPPHEGGSRLPGVVLIGDSPGQQLTPAMRRLSAHRRLRRWALVGSDYIWAWSVHHSAKSLIRSLGSELVLERLVPFGLRDGPDCEELIDALGRARADVVVLSLIGRDLAMFNRVFTAARLASTIVRISGALEENGLLAAGGDDSGELYAAMRSFAGQQDPRRIALAENYHRAFGDTAPVLDAYSEGCYDGVHLAAGLAAVRGLTADRAQPMSSFLLNARSTTADQAWARAPLGRPREGTCLARATGLELSVLPTKLPF